MVKYGVPAIALCIGPKGMAKTPQEKLEVASSSMKLVATQYDLKPSQCIFDVLAFTIVTGNPELLMQPKIPWMVSGLSRRNFPSVLLY